MESKKGINEADAFIGGEQDWTNLLGADDRMCRKFRHNSGLLSARNLIYCCPSRYDLIESY